MRIFERLELIGRCDRRAGLATGDNERFLRFWREVAIERSSRVASCSSETRRLTEEWFPTQKGGGFRKWYGNVEFVVDWENDGRMRFKRDFAPESVISATPMDVLSSSQALTWSVVTCSIDFRLR